VLRQKFPEYVLGTGIAVTVEDGDVLGDRHARRCRLCSSESRALLRDRGIHFTDDLIIIIADQH
jgi:hypothetical protein